MARMTLKEAKAILKPLGITLAKRASEYRVNFRGGIEPSAYYTMDLEDAVGTGRAMAAQRPKRLRPVFSMDPIGSLDMPIPQLRVDWIECDG